MNVLLECIWALALLSLGYHFHKFLYNAHLESVLESAYKLEERVKAFEKNQIKVNDTIKEVNDLRKKYKI